jgi:hypothetical protein
MKREITPYVWVHPDEETAHRVGPDAVCQENEYRPAPHLPGSVPRHALNECSEHLHHLLLRGLVDASLVGLLEL